MATDTFLSTLSLRRATLRHQLGLQPGVFFYPRSPCGERQQRGAAWQLQQRTFLSTLSLRRATQAQGLKIPAHGVFYPRSPCGERLHYDNYNLHCVEISIHALLAESDTRQNQNL